MDVKPKWASGNINVIVEMKWIHREMDITLFGVTTTGVLTASRIILYHLKNQSNYFEASNLDEYSKILI